MTGWLSGLFVVAAIVYIFWPTSKHPRLRGATTYWRLHVGFWAAGVVVLTVSAAVRERPSWGVVAGVTTAALALGWWTRPTDVGSRPMRRRSDPLRRLADESWAHGSKDTADALRHAAADEEARRRDEG